MGRVFNFQKIVDESMIEGILKKFKRKLRLEERNILELYGPRTDKSILGKRDPTKIQFTAFHETKHEYTVIQFGRRSETANRYIKKTKKWVTPIISKL